MVDFARLEMVIDSSEVDTGVNKLDSLTAAGAKAEGAVGRLDTSMQGASRSTKSASAAAAEYAARAQASANAAMGMGNNVGRMGNASRLSANQIQNLTFQLNDMFVGLASGQRPMTVFMQQGAQIGQIAQQAGLGIGGMARALFGLAGAATAALVTNPLLLGIAAAAGAAYLAISSLNDAANDSGSMEAYARSLGLTSDEIKKLENVTVTFGDTAKAVFQVVGNAIWDSIGPAVTDVWDVMVDWTNWIFTGVKNAVNFLIGGFVGGYNMITTTWSSLPGVMADLFYSAVNAGIDAINSLIQKSVTGINGFIEAANTLLREAGLEIPTLSAPQIGRLENEYAGAARRVGTAFQAGMQDAMGVDYLGNFGASVAEQARQNARNRIKADAEAQGFLDPEKGGGGARGRAQRLSDEEKAYLAAVKAAKEYIAALQEETSKIGKNAIEIKNMEIAAAAAKAPTEELRRSIIQAGLQWELATRIQADTDFQNNIIRPLQDEIALLGLVGTERERSALALEETAFKAKALKDGVSDVNAAWEQYLALQTQIIDNRAAEEQMERYLSALDEVAAITDRAAQGMADAFGRVGDSIGRLASIFSQYAADRVAAEQRLARLEREGRKGTAEYIAAKQAQKAMDLDYYRNVASGAKAFFKEGSDGYKALAAAEKALAVLQLINTARSVAAGAAKMFATLGPFAFPAVAAMLGVMASLGFSGGGSSSRGPSAQELQEAAGTGSVLGDSKAKSASISRSLEIMSKNSNRDLEYSNQMVRSLRSIESGIGTLASAIAKELSLTGGAFDTSGFNLGSKTSLGLFGNAAIGAGFGALGFLVTKLPVIGGIITGIAKALFGTKTTRTLLDQGLSFDPQTVEAILSGGITGNTYSDIEVKKRKKFFGINIGGSTRVDTVTGELDGGMTRQVGLLIGSLRSSIIDAAGILGIEGAAAALDAFTVNIGKISLKDLSGSEIQEQLEAVFSKLGDDMAAAAIPGIDAFQKVGEGLFETLARLAKDYVTIDTQLKSIGMTFGAVGASSVAAREELIDLFGTLDDFVEQTEFFRDNFLSEAERIAPIANALRDELARLGLSSITTKEQFKDAVLGLDLSTESGRELYASLLNIAPAFSTVSDYVESLNQTMRDEFSETVEKFTGYADSLRKYRETLFQTDASAVNAFAIARSRFAEIAALAAGGNGDALGKLEGVSRTYLERARENATTFQQYQRDVAAVANAVDAGIFAAEETADYAQLQLDALDNSVAILTSIDTNNAALLQEIRALRSENAALTLQVIENGGAVRRLWERFEGDGLPVRGVEGGDTPLQVEVTS